MSDARRALLERDARARGIARTHHEGVVVVEAGAGTGKTSLLVARILVWCLGPGWRKHASAPDPAARVLDRLVAITFTDKAAAEMTRRVTEALEQVRAGRATGVIGFDAAETGEEPQCLQHRAEALLLSIERLQASTIHSWCQHLLRSWNLAAGLHPGATVDAEQMRVPAVVEEVVVGQLGEGYGDPGDEDQLLLLRHEVGPAEIAQALTALAQRDVPPDLLDQDPHAPGRIGDYLESLGGAVDDLVQDLQVALAGDGHRHLAKAQELLAALEACQQVMAGEAPLVELPRRAAEVPDRLRDYAKQKLTQTEAKRFGARAERIQHRAAVAEPLLAELASFDLQRFAAARRVLARLLRDVRARLDGLGVVTFQALLQRTHDLVTGMPVVAATIRRGLDQILVDEFQDTDRLQCGILRAIALAGPEAERPGLFLVGDPKQSIYGWRNADLAAYDEFVAAALDGRARESLLVNFRSVDPVLNEVTRICAPLLLAQQGLQAAWEPLLVSERRAQDPGFARGGRAPVEHWITWATHGERVQARTLAGPAREFGAAALVRDLRALHDEHSVPWSDCALLLRATTQVDVYLDAMRQAGIPFAIEREGSFYQRREVVDAAALLRAVLDPSDRVALLAMLRAPFAGVPDAAIAALWRAGLPELAAGLHGGRPPDAELSDCTAAARAGIGDAPVHAGWEAALRDALAALAELRQALRVAPADEFLRLLRDRLALPATAAARFLGLHRLANLQRFFRAVELALLDPARGPEALLRELRRGLDGLLRAPEGGPGDAGMDAVHVLTIHKSKGLQWPHVYVADLHAQLTLRERDSEKTDVELLRGFVHQRLFGWPSLGWSDVEARREQVARAETVRLLYVATTRAADRLVLVGRWPEAARDVATMREIAELVAQRGHPDLEALAADPHAGQGILHDGALWRVHSAAELPDQDGAPKTSLDHARHGDGAQRLRHAAAAAIELEKLPRTAPASRDVMPEPDAGSPQEHRQRLPAEHAQELGVRLHELMERLDPTISDEELRAALRPLLPADRIDRLLRGEPMRRFRALGKNLRARELPFLVAAEPGDPASEVLAGAIDLLYSDPVTGELVVADYKTGAVADPARHAAQARTYPRAVQRALGLERPPRFELWYLLEDRIEVVQT